MVSNPTLNARSSSREQNRVSEKLPPRNWPALYKTDFSKIGDIGKNPTPAMNSSNQGEPVPVLRWSVLA
jgi:hypothetical protein